MKLLLYLPLILACSASGQTLSIDSTVEKLMDSAGVTGLCLGVVRADTVAYVQAYGYKSTATRQKNDTATSFYATSFSKAVFAYLVMQLVDEGKLDLDKPLFTYLPKPIPEYTNYKDLEGDNRWQLITARNCLDHSTGFPNWRQFNPRGNNKLEIFFTPGERYAYSGEGLYLLQLVVETITHRSLEDLAREKIFIPFGMTRTSYLWQPAFETDYALGHNVDEVPYPLDKRTKANAAGSMETTIADYTRFMAAVLQGRGLSAASQQAMLSPQIAIHSLHEFPSLDTNTTTANKAIHLSYGLGWGLFTTPQGLAFFKEGHGDGWQHYWIAFPRSRSAFVIMTNSDNGESIFQELVGKLTGVTLPWVWEGYTPYRATVRLSSSDLRPFAGEYYGKQNAFVSLDSGGLLRVESVTAGLPPTRLYAAGAHHFFLKVMATDVDFVDGKAVLDDEGEHYELRKVEEDSLRAFAETYRAGSDHKIIITLERGRLYAQGTNPADRLPKVVLHATSENEFFMEGAALKFRFVGGMLVTYGSDAKDAEWEKNVY